MVPETLLTRRVAEVIDEKHLRERLLQGDKLRVKLGIDPSKPDLHIGHAVTLRKLREFQDAGHTAVLIIGDYTAQIGDPTDRSEARNMLSEDEVKKNAEGYLDQAFKILEQSKTEVRYQSEWFKSFTLRQTIELLSTATWSQVLEHETFRNRLNKSDPVHLHEILYPLLQGYDSVQVKADVELGAMDQKFNVLAGRAMQRAHNQPEQDVVLLQYLPGTDGEQKMSKSLGNTININDTPDDMFGKIMSIQDKDIPIYFELTTSVPESIIETVKDQLTEQSINPRDLKADLAKTIVTEFHSESAAAAASAAFDKVFRQKQAPDDIEELHLPTMTYELVDLLAHRSTLAQSKSEARRLILQKGVKVNGQVIEDVNATIIPADDESITIQVGPRRFLKVIWKQS